MDDERMKRLMAELQAAAGEAATMREHANRMRQVKLSRAQRSDHDSYMSAWLGYAEDERMEKQKAAISEALWRGICKDPQRIEEFLNDGR